MKNLNMIATLSFIVGIVLRVIGIISLKIMFVFFIPAFGLILYGFITEMAKNNSK